MEFHLNPGHLGKNRHTALRYSLLGLPGLAGTAQHSLALHDPEVARPAHEARHTDVARAAWVRARQDLHHGR
jgi:hypothetical protein